MAGFTGMPKLLLLLVVVATCRVQGQATKLLTCVVDAPKENCPVILTVNGNRTIVGKDSIRVRAKFGSPGNDNKGIAEATVVIDPLPAGLVVKKANTDCQRKKDCKTVKPCFVENGGIAATVEMARALDIKITFTTKPTSGVITGTLWTSCGEKIPLMWDLSAGLVPTVPISGPEPVGAPVQIAGPEGSSPVAAPTVAPQEPQAGGPTP